MRSTRRTGGILLLLILAMPALCAGQSKVREQDLKIASSGIELAATIAVPAFEKERRAPALLIVPEWGAVTRDGTSQTSTYRDISNQLSSHGIAVLRYDRRCSGKSTCKPQSGFDDYVEDVTAAIKYLRQRTEVDPARVAILGHGFGGLIALTALLAIEQEARPAVLVLAATPGRVGSKLVREQVSSRLTQQRKTPAESQSYLAQVDAWLSILETGARLSADARIDPADTLLTSLAGQPEVAMVMLTADPLRAMRAVTIPVLLIQGESDVEVKASDARYFAEALKRSGQSDVHLELIPKVNHWFSDSSNASLVGTATLDPLVNWLVRKLAID
jgi:alpha-beta hydrolase superfamily lysophospholipase